MNGDGTGTSEPDLRKEVGGTVSLVDERLDSLTVGNVKLSGDGRHWHWRR